MKYKELNLTKIRNDCNIDFAHYTYRKYMCSHCYGPQDLSKKYWKNGEIKEDNYTYILFENARNTMGYVKPEETIRDIQSIRWVLTPEQLSQVCKELQEQMKEYTVFVPNSPEHTILVIKVGTKIPEWLVKNISKNYYPTFINNTESQKSRG